MKTTILAVMLAAAPAAAQSVPELFAPGVVSTEFMETSASFTPDGNTVYFTRSDFAGDNTIMFARRVNGRWTAGDVAPFSGVWRDSEPHVAPDGNRLFFVSNRPVNPGDGPLLARRGTVSFPGANIWYVERRGNDWSEPVHIDGPVNAVPMVYNPVVSRNGTLYFSGVLPEDSTKNQIYRSVPVNGRYGQPERLPFSDLRFNHMDPAVHPDERFLVFASQRPQSVGSADLFIVFRSADGSWGEPVHLGASVNSPALENAPTLGPDGRTLYFTSMRGANLEYPKERLSGAAFMERLRSPLNGARNLWTVSLSEWLD